MKCCQIPASVRALEVLRKFATIAEPSAGDDNTFIPRPIASVFSVAREVHGLARVSAHTFP